MTLEIVSVEVSQSHEPLYVPEKAGMPLVAVTLENET